MENVATMVESTPPVDVAMGEDEDEVCGDVGGGGGGGDW